MNPSPSLQTLNRQLAEKVDQEARSDPQSAYAGKFVGIANGQVVVVADTRDEMVRQLRQVEPNQQKTAWIEAGAEVEYIWSLV